jgi:hypothetical protein
MTDPNTQHSRGGQQGSTHDGGKDPEETKVGNNSMDASKGTDKTARRSAEDFSHKQEQQKRGDPENPSETTGATESGAEDKGAKA